MARVSQEVFGRITDTSLDPCLLQGIEDLVPVMLQKPGLYDGVQLFGMLISLGLCFVLRVQQFGDSHYTVHWDQSSGGTDTNQATVAIAAGK